MGGFGWLKWDQRKPTRPTLYKYDYYFSHLRHTSLIASLTFTYI